MRRLAPAALFLALFAREALADEPPANEALKGFRYVLKPGFTYQKANATAMPPVRQDVTFAISNHFGWAFPLGPLVLSPGGSLPIYFFDYGDDYSLTLHAPGATLGVLGEIEVHVPLKYVSVYGVAGAGAAFFFGSNTQGGVFRGGGGIMVYPQSWIGIGGQATVLAMSNAAKGPDSSLLAVEITWPLELRF